MLDSVKNDRSKDLLTRPTSAWPTGGVAWPKDDAALDGVVVVVADVAAEEKQTDEGTLITLLNTLTSSKNSRNRFFQPARELCVHFFTCQPESLRS